MRPIPVHVLYKIVIIISIEICEVYYSCAEVGGSNESVRYQMDIELLRFENVQGLEVYGMPCDPMKQGCDTRIFAYLDWIKPDDEWPGSRELEHDDTVYEVADPMPTSFDIRKTFMTQLCGNHTKNVTLRVKVQDDDKIFRGTDDLIGIFNCRFANFPVQHNETIAEWTKPDLCQPVRHLSYEPVATESVCNDGYGIFATTDPTPLAHRSTDRPVLLSFPNKDVYLANAVYPHLALSACREIFS